MTGKPSSSLSVNLLQNDGRRHKGSFLNVGNAINEEAVSQGSFRSNKSSKYEAEPFEREIDDMKSRFDSSSSEEDSEEAEDLEIKQAYSAPEGLKSKLKFLRR